MEKNISKILDISWRFGGEILILVIKAEVLILDTYHIFRGTLVSLTLNYINIL